MQEIQIMLAIITVCVFYICVMLVIINANLTGVETKVMFNKVSSEHKTPPKAKIKPAEQTDEQRQHNTLMSNIDNYNGTGAKQEKVR